MFSMTFHESLQGGPRMPICCKNLERWNIRNAISSICQRFRSLLDGIALKIALGLSSEVPFISNVGIFRRLALTHINYILSLKEDYSGYNECLYRFMVQNKGQTTTRVIKLFLEMPTTSKSVVKDVCLGGETFKNKAIRRDPKQNCSQK